MQSAPADQGAPAAVQPSLEPTKSRRLYLLLREQLLSGAVEPGGQLPSEPELAARHAVSRVTVRRALDGLEQDGLIRRQPGAGTFALGPGVPRTILADLNNMLAQIEEMGRTTRVRLLSFGYGRPPPAIAAALKLEPAERTQRSVRVRLIDEQPFSHLVTHVPERIGGTYSDAELATTPLLSLLERSGVRVERAAQTITASLAGPEVADALGLDVGAPVLALTRVVFDAHGKGVEHLAATYRPDRYMFQMELVRTGQGADRFWHPVARGARGNGAAAPLQGEKR
jgi:GntR family transcriptional regulator